MPIDTIPSPFKSLDLTCSGSAEVHVIIRQGTTNDATISYEKTNGRDTYFAESKLDFDVENSKLTARFITPTFTSFNMFGFGNELSVQLVVSLPSDIEDFAFQGNWGRFVLEGPNFGGNVNIKNTVGAVRIPSSLSSKSISIETNTGSIKALGSLSAQSIQLNSKVGAIHTQSLTADAVEINTNTGSIHVDQVTATQDVTLNSNVGAVEINNVSANSLVVNSRTGSITFSKAQISNQVSLTNSTGSIKGWFQGYSSLNTVNGTGSAKMTLIPGSTTSKTSIKTELGSIDAIVKGFRGRFSANTDLGKVYVSGGENGEFGQDKSSLSGVVGEDVGALMDFKTGTGKVQISFLPELNPKEQ